MENLFAQNGVVTTPGSGEVTGLVTTLIILLLVATGVALITRRLRTPYVTGLVLAGLAVTELLPGQVGLDPALVLNLFLPILIFEAAINTDISRLRSTFKPIALLAGPGIFLASAITAVLLKYSLGFDWIPAMFAGVILAITDTVSVIAVFKEVPVPSRLSTIVEGESLFNDGVALVLFGLIANVYTLGSISFLEGLQQLTVVMVGGTLVGLIFGYLSVGLSRQSDDALSDILLTVAVALGAFQTGQFLGVSGAVAVVVAGLVYGNLGIARNVSATAKITILSFWDYAGFGVNTFIFLLIGLEVDLITLWQTLPLVLVAILVYQAGRALTIYPLLALLRLFDRPIPIKWQHVLFLGNVKGSLSMALALSIPLGLPGREQVIPLIFGTVLMSLVGQGLSLPWLVKRLKLSGISGIRQQVEASQIQLIAAKAAQDELDNLLKSGVLPKAVYEELRAAYQARIASSERLLRDLYNQRAQTLENGDDRTKLDAIRRRLLLAEKGAVNDALRKRMISEDLVQTYIKDLNEKLLALDDD
ncbi:cation:proton antiporter [Egbenema bharatensis]|uniref:cation:proton antiporter n=1 Tax=Egbenema bharatensis TaxID=3463334 RepID=UPI003A8A117D